ncbi:TRZ/ATZ family hydrolase [Kushneria aurantia]|uniref:5-methylthioadenosine/S-adenosylhomocysteine deaminase n=1 Tax=Kushneria aurantia TaxID=504092 RepID=A0ABV6G437_9GAMM|nr:TRZ/ATZ family hydrolase [Kushneria aurantia]
MSSHHLTAERVIECRWLLPMSDNLPLREHHALAIRQGRILDSGPIDEMRRRHSPQQRLELTHHAVMPGLINAHNHAGMALMRGYADDLPLMQWLNEHIWPAEAAHMNTAAIVDGTRLAIAEMLRSGTTTFADMYFAPEEVADLLDESGMRAQLCTPLMDFETPWARDFRHGIEKSVALAERLRGHDRLRVALGPHAPYTVGDDSLEQLVEARDRLGVPIQMHIHETHDEVTQSLQQYGARPLERLRRAGVVTADLQAVHLTQLNDEEIDLLATSGASAIHSPQSNLKLASGFCPVARLLEAGVRVALGTDGACSNNDLDMFDEMRSAALLAKGVSGNAAALPAMATLAMATREGAAALGMADVTGRLEPAMAADIMAVDLDSLEAQPLHDPASALVYAVNSRQVSHLWVAGELLLDEGRLTREDETELMALAKKRGRELAQGREGEKQ